MAVVADVALVAVAALPLIEIPHVPVAPVPPVDGAPTVLYEIVRAVEPLKDVPDASPEPPLLNVTEAGVEMAVYTNAEPFQFKYVPAVVGAVINAVVAKAVLYGI